MENAMDSVVWFFIIIGAIVVGIVGLAIGLAVAVIGIVVLTKGGGFRMIIGALLICGGIALVINIGGPAGGFGILLALIGGWVGVIGGAMFVEMIRGR
jgi:hypothetical protein